MKRAVLTHPSLLGCLSNLQLHSRSQQLKSLQKILHQKYTSLTTSLGKPAITAPQAKKLVSLGFSHARLKQLRVEDAAGCLALDPDCLTLDPNCLTLDPRRMTASLVVVCCLLPWPSTTWRILLHSWLLLSSAEFRVLIN